MIAYSLAVLAGILVDAWLLAFVTLRGRRPWLQATFAALALALIVNGAAFVGTSEGLLSASWEAAVLWTLVLAHPLAAVLVLSLLHGTTLPRGRPLAFALLALAPLVVLLTPSADWAVAHAYEPDLLGAYLILCLGVPLAEAVYRRMTSTLFAADAFWLAFAVVVLIIGGPIYSLEFQDLGLLQSAGSNVAAPAAMALFALVLFHTEPFPGTARRRSPRFTGHGAVEPGTAVVFEEARPKYAVDLAARASASREPVLVLAREAAIALPQGTRLAVLVPTRHAAERTLASAAEFVASARGGLVVLLGLADLSMMSGWPWTQEALFRLRDLARDTGAAIIVSTSRLTAREREELRRDEFVWWSLPDPAAEFETLLTPSFGPGARRLLEAFSRSEGIRWEDLTLSHVEPFLRFLNRAVADLGSTSGDEAARRGLRAQVETASTALRAFTARDASDLAKGDWPSKHATSADRGLLVTAADYWKGKEMEELFSAAADLGERGSWYERARAVFVEQLGDAGEGVLRSELAKLGRKPEDLRPEDVTRLADRAVVDLAALAEVVDLPQEKIRIQGQVESIRLRLAAMTGDQR